MSNDTALGDDLTHRDTGETAGGFLAVCTCGEGVDDWHEHLADQHDALTAALREARHFAEMWEGNYERADEQIGIQKAEVERRTEQMHGARHRMHEQRKRAERAEAEVERLHTWDGLMSLLNEHWPEDIFPTEPDCEDRDSGVRLVSAVRRADRAEAERDRLAAQVEAVRRIVVNAQEFGDEVDLDDLRDALDAGSAPQDAHTAPGATSSTQDTQGHPDATTGPEDGAHSLDVGSTS